MFYLNLFYEKSLVAENQLIGLFRFYFYAVGISINIFDLFCKILISFLIL